MLFLAGPRQVGKTTLAKHILAERKCSNLYYNWDEYDQRKKLLKDPYAFEKDIPLKKSRKNPLIVFDEIHKYPRWKNYLKGVYDKYSSEMDFLVTGSGRLNIYKKGGDSLFGRYFMYNFFPLSLTECLQTDTKLTNINFSDFPPPNKENEDILEQLLSFSGFPEPYLKADKSFLRRWQKDHHELIIKQDIRDLTNVRDISLMEMMMTYLPARIGSPLSLNSLAEDVDTSFKTIKNWIDILERVYYIFSILPYYKNIKRAIKKERKIYFWNWLEAANEAGIFENLIACHLKKLADTLTDFGIEDVQLRYCRDKEQREVDFLLLRDNKPWTLVEAKLSDRGVSKSLTHFMSALGLREAFQVIRDEGVHFVRKVEGGRVHIISADIFLNALL